MDNPSKNPYTNRTNFVNLGKNFCGRMFGKAVKGCSRSANYLSKKSSYYNRKIRNMFGALPPEKKGKEQDQEQEQQNQE